MFEKCSPVRLSIGKEHFDEQYRENSDGHVATLPFTAKARIE